MRSNHIVVGADGSVPSWDALHWAVGTARRWRAALQILTVDDLRRARPIGTADSRLAQMVTEARRLEPSIRITGAVARGDVVPALCRAAHDSRMIVLGCRDGGGFGHRRVGWISQQVCAEATVPVTVVRGDTAGQGTIVVGVDGTAGSEAALASALDEARLRDCTVIAVFAYSHQFHPWLAGGQPPSDPQLLHASAYAALESTVAPWREKFPGVTITARTTSTPVVPFLTDLSRHAQLLVVGAHGHEPTPGLLGSVPAKVLRRAHCPVLIVP
jgi:nucleotide-binding universal stress UspA family protein